MRNSRASHEVVALHDERLAGLGRRVIGDGVARGVEDHGADHPLRSSVRSDGLSGEGEERGSARAAARFHCGLPGGVLVTV